VVTLVYPVSVPTEPATFGNVAADIMERIEGIHADMKEEAVAYLNRAAAP
jgi:hypothetical protein